MMDVGKKRKRKSQRRIKQSAVCRKGGFNRVHQDLSGLDGSLYVSTHSVCFIELVSRPRDALSDPLESNRGYRVIGFVIF